VNDNGDRRWRCSSCRVVVRFQDGYGPPGELPSGWIRHGRGLRCLRCRREAVSERAKARARRQGISGWMVMAAARKALIEIELDRDPAASDAAIAKRLGISSAAIVKKLRAEADRDRQEPAGGAPRGSTCPGTRSPSDVRPRVRSGDQEDAT
jgi:hypothetical protein